MRTYEMVVLLHPDLEIDVDAPIAKIEKLIEAATGKVTKRDNWGKKRLAYQVKKHQFAIYVYFEIEMEPTGVRDLERTILITEEVIRHIIVLHVEPPVQEKSTKEEAETPVAEAAAVGKEG